MVVYMSQRRFTNQELDAVIDQPSTQEAITGAFLGLVRNCLLLSCLLTWTLLRIITTIIIMVICQCTRNQVRDA